MDLYESEVVELKEIYTPDLKKVFLLQIQMAEQSLLVYKTMEILSVLIMQIL